MSIQKLWYIKDGDEVLGPFPAKIIIQNLHLKRASIHDMVSLDKLSWLPVSEFSELMPQPLSPPESASEAIDPETQKWREERFKASQRWMDERTGERRAEALVSDDQEDAMGRSMTDRREAGANDDGLQSVHHASRRVSVLKHPRYGYWGIVVFLIVSVFVVVIGLLVFKPVNPVKVDIGLASTDCTKKAMPGINWRACDKAGVWLQDANLSDANLSGAHLNSAVLKNANLSNANLAESDLSYANLTGAKLIDANLQQANLSNAELQGAEMQGADMRGAILDAVVLDGAKLDNALWPDGRQCAVGSVGQCNPE